MLNQELLEVKKYREVLKNILVVIHCDYHLYTASIMYLLTLYRLFRVAQNFISILLSTGSLLD